MLKVSRLIPSPPLIVLAGVIATSAGGFTVTIYVVATAIVLAHQIVADNTSTNELGKLRFTEVEPSKSRRLIRELHRLAYVSFLVPSVAVSVAALLTGENKFVDISHALVMKREHLALLVVVGLLLASSTARKLRLPLTILMVAAMWPLAEALVHTWSVVVPVRNIGFPRGPAGTNVLAALALVVAMFSDFRCEARQTAHHAIRSEFVAVSALLQLTFALVVTDAIGRVTFHSVKHSSGGEQLLCHVVGFWQIPWRELESSVRSCGAFLLIAWGVLRVSAAFDVDQESPSRWMKDVPALIGTTLVAMTLSQVASLRQLWFATSSIVLLDVAASCRAKIRADDSILDWASQIRIGSFAATLGLAAVAIWAACSPA